MNMRHNSKTTKAGPVHGKRLKSFVERIERMEEERKAIAGDIRDIYAEAKAIGYDVGTMRMVVRLRAMDAADRAEQEALLDTYWHALQTVDRIDARLAAGESQREVAAAEGVSKSTVQRRGPKVESAPASSEMDRSKPEDGDDGITESVEAGSIGVEAGRPSEPSDPAEQSVNAVPPPGLVTPASDNGKGEQPGTHSNEAPATPSVGAVAAEPRVATSNHITSQHIGCDYKMVDDDMPAQPAFLRGKAAA